MPTQMICPTDLFEGRITTVDEYRALAVARAVKRGKAIAISADTLYPSIIAGWYRALCPNCNAGISVHPEWAFAACFGLGCYRVYERIVLPAEWPEIEASLLQRQMKDQHWHSGHMRTIFEGRGRVQLPDETLDEIREQTAVIRQRDAEARA